MSVIYQILRVFSLLALLVCAGACPPEESVRVDQDVRGVSQPVVYGEDDRMEVYRYQGDTFARASQSLIALIPPTSITELKDGGLAPAPQPAKELLQLCDDEPFADQPAAARCSGVLIDDDLVLTAGHCFSEQDSCDIYSYVFDYHYSRQGQAAGISDLDVYGCSALLVREKRTLPGGVVHDFAIVQLDRKVDLRRRAVPLRRALPWAGESVTVMGSPQGLPSKIDTGGTVQKSPGATRGYWYADTDTFGGSSGSPAYDADMRLMGILIRGNHDYEEDPEEFCRRAKRVSSGEEVEGRYEQFASLTPALSALCTSAGSEQHAVCNEPEAVEGSVALACSAHRNGGRSWAFFGILSIVAALRFRRRR